MTDDVIGYRVMTANHLPEAWRDGMDGQELVEVYTYVTCTCQFEADPDDPDEDAEPWHYRRVCTACGVVWYGLHCRHDGHQNPCPRCGTVPVPKPTNDTLARDDEKETAI